MSGPTHGSEGAGGPEALLVHTRSAEETRRVAAAVAALVRVGDLLLLAGELGAGKTAFVQGFGQALGVEQRITSPTFTLANRYQGRILVHHLDVYRLEQLDEIVDLGIDELLDDRAVTVVEWGDAIAPALPADHLEIRLGFGAGDDDRSIVIRPTGPRWAGRQAELRAALGPWLEGRGSC